MLNPERVWRLANPFRVDTTLMVSVPRVVASLQPWGFKIEIVLTLKGFGGWRTLFRVDTTLMVSVPRVRASSNPGLTLANAFGVSGDFVLKIL